ncbi:hypothetical protein NW762_012829 [Fusarium torreyae]|uniref:TAM domain methyltransferase n=1 Tax=Fusarium torreyae TaxID=1237075 RepID=A0A9W8RR79_9HYPO|nr:hypothetical protein NW762_012829 [Fusarium torreyae]
MTGTRCGSNPPAKAPIPANPADPAPFPLIDLVPANQVEVRTLSSTDSVSASILEYRRIQGRTYHSDKFRNDYVFPNDEQQLKSVYISHHYLTLLLDGKLFLAPIKENVQNVLDVGTGSGIWAMDFAEHYPNAEIVGTDLSPCQPEWVLPNVRFEIDDATETWTWEDNHFDFIHIRYLFGAIPDWYHLFEEAYRCCAPGGWIESVEADVRIRSDDGTVDLEPVWKVCDKMYEEGGKALGRSFFIPIGGWPKDPTMAQIGRFVQQTVENDLEGYSYLLWNQFLKWPNDEYQIFLMQLRKAHRNRKVHSYITTRYVYGRKPESSG